MDPDRSAGPDFQPVVTSVCRSSGRGLRMPGASKSRPRSARLSPVLPVLLSLALLVPLLWGCAAQRKLETVRSEEVRAGLNLGPGMESLPEVQRERVVRDTLKVRDEDGREMLIMRAVKDEEGEMVASDVIDAAFVTARFRNVSERSGKVDLSFEVVVPAAMRDSRWQLRLDPDMYVLGNSLRLDPVVITGAAFRKAQLRGYQQYERFLSRIVSDTTRFINIRLLETFLELNIPQIYSYKRDSSLVDDEVFLSHFGVSERQAVEHYTNKLARSLNERRKSRMGEMYRRYVKVPLVTEGIRLDTVVVDGNGDFVYNYVQTINTRPRLRKVDIVLSGEIRERDRPLYRVPRSEPLTFYISSISSLADGRERYLTKVVERRAVANTACYVDFAQGRSEVDLGLGHNREEVARIKSNIGHLVENRSFDLDSIVVTAYASPEGGAAANARLSRARSQSISKYLDAFIRAYRDSLDSAEGMVVGEDGRMARRRWAGVPFVSRSEGENWKMLDILVIRDTVLSEDQKSTYSELSTIEDPDLREESMRRRMESYGYLRSALYPRLRTVRFDFHLHRKGMVRDTVVTTVVDSVYAAGVQALRDFDYNLAIRLLRPYGDLNTAIACLAAGRDLSALEILEALERSPKVDYLLAVAYSRTGEPQRAVQRYLDACRADRSYIHRGNLDPEISLLIRTYGLNAEE